MMRRQCWERFRWLPLLWMAALLCAGTVKAQPVLGATDMRSVAPGVTVEVLALKRTPGDTVTLEFAVVNKTDKAVDVVQKHFTAYSNSDVGKVTLVDWGNKKRYWVIRDEDGNCLCSSGDYRVHNVPANDRKAFWARFPAPPADVTRLSIHIPGGFPLDDIPIGN